MTVELERLRPVSPWCNLRTTGGLDGVEELVRRDIASGREKVLLGNAPS